MPDPCLFCGQPPIGDAWNKPCEDSPDRLHWTREQWTEAQASRALAAGASLRRAAYELDKVADAIEALPERIQRKLRRASAPSFALDPGIIRNEAERARDTLHTAGLLDA